MMDFADVLSEQLANVLVAALRRDIDGKKQLIVADVDALWFENVDKLVVDLEDQRVRFGVDRAIDIGPHILRNRRQVPMLRKQVVAVRKRRQRRDQLNVMQPDPPGQIGYLLLFEKPSIRHILMGGVLLHLVEGSAGIVAAAQVRVSGKFHPAGVQFRMAVEPHARIHFHDEGVVFIKRHKVAYKALEERDIAASGKEQIDSSKGLVGPIANLHAAKSQPVLIVDKQLTKRLQPVESAPVAVAGYNSHVAGDAKKIALRATILHNTCQPLLCAIPADQRVLH